MSISDLDGWPVAGQDGARILEKGRGEVKGRQEGQYIPMTLDS